MDDWYARAVFFVRDAERSLGFYTEKLGFSLDWTDAQLRGQEADPSFVFQVSLHGFSLIVNQVDPRTTEGRAGHGRVFVGLEPGEQAESLRRQIEERQIETTVVEWGKPTRVIRDLDGNELFFWPSLSEGADSHKPPLASEES